MTQRGPFYPHILTFGTTKEFAEKKPVPKSPFQYGVWKSGDNAHTGFNKTFGGHSGRSTEYCYVEQREEDKLVIKDRPVWRTTN